MQCFTYTAHHSVQHNNCIPINNIALEPAASWQLPKINTGDRDSNLFAPSLKKGPQVPSDTPDEWNACKAPETFHHTWTVMNRLLDEVEALRIATTQFLLLVSRADCREEMDQSRIEKSPFPTPGKEEKKTRTPPSLMSSLQSVVIVDRFDSQNQQPARFQGFARGCIHVPSDARIEREPVDR